MDDLGAISSLNDRWRRQLYDYVAAAAEPVTRDEASAALGIDRAVVAYHLDKLVEEGLLATSFARPEGRPGGPGAGRPAKHYQRGDREFAVTVPARDYGLAAEVFARAAEADETGDMRRRLERSAREVGRELAVPTDGATDLIEHLRRQGFEPYADGGVIRLGNCPFHQLARNHTELVCGMNLAMLAGLVEGLGVADVDARLDPAPDRCCVALHAVGAA